MKTCLLLADVPAASDWLTRAIHASSPGITVVATACLAEARLWMASHSAPELAHTRPTDRETEVLRLIARGLSTAEVARDLNISVNTVPSHIKEIYRKLNVASRAEAALTVRSLGLG